MNLQPTLSNDLVLVRPLQIEDFEALYNVAKDPLIWKLHQNPDRWEITEFKKFFQGALDSQGAFVIVDRETNKVIGSSRYHIPENTTKAIEIGWTFVSRAYWGGVYNKAFKALLIAHAFQYVDYILFHIDQNNIRSQKATIKLGGRPIDSTGPLRELHTPVATGLTFVLEKTEIA